MIALGTLHLPKELPVMVTPVAEKNGVGLKPAAGPAAKGRQRWAVAAFLTAVLALPLWFFAPLSAFLAGLLSLALGVFSLWARLHAPGRFRGRWWAVAGLVLGAGGFLVPAFLRVQDASNQVANLWHLKVLSLAMHNYHDTHGRLPSAALSGNDGQSLLSWRVALLPFLDERQLCEEFHLDEPWDSPHNVRLLSRMPVVYRPFAREVKAPPYHTFYQVLVGKGTSFEIGRKVSIPGSFTNGLSNTILIAEAATPVPWTKPEDLSYAPDQPLPRLGGLAPEHFLAAMGDGSVRSFAKDTNEKTLRQAIHREAEPDLKAW
jgi:Protein of unknown function (DUF1559)